MKVHKGRSSLDDAVAAVAEATAEFSGAPELVLAFCSTRQDPEAVARALAARFPGAPIAGCTTSGELLSGEHTNGSLVVCGLVDSGVRWASATIHDLKRFDEAAARAVASSLFSALDVSQDAVDPAEHFCLLFVDGLSMREESVSALLADAIEGVPLAGGSAGDDLKFERTMVLSESGW